MTNLSGQVIRGYEFLKPIGSGGYGMVYEALEQSVDRRVAIKIILPEHANQPEFIANFEHEAKLVAQLEHLSIVPLYTYWRDEHGAFLVMRYIKGGSLREMLAKHGALSLAQTTRIVSQIADALHAAHESGVVHRDLKPDNILIDERGNAYLTDFGIAKRADGNKSATDAIKGTFAYLSPEQIQAQPVSPQTDIYAFGVMLYEVLAGKHPFQDTPAAMMVMRHLQESLPLLHQARPELPGDIDDIISKATAKDPTERHDNILTIIAELKATFGETVTPAAAKPIATAMQKTRQSTNPEQRNRYAMLQNVRAFWIEGVLDNSLHNAIKIDLGLQAASGVVDNPWDTLLRTPSGDMPLAADTHIMQIFERMNGKLLILGDPGGGKTTTLLELARELLTRAETDEAHPIPVVFNLSSWGEKQLPLTEWLLDELNSKYQVPRKVALQWVQDEAILPLLDGLDEVTETARDACVQAINTYRSEHGFVDMVVCSRIRDYEALTNQLKLNGAVVIQPLADDQIQHYLTALGSDVAVVRDLITRDEQLRELAQSPLMLSVIILAYRGTSASDIPDFDNIETQRKHLFDIYVRRVFERRVGDKPYSPEQTQHYLSWLAQKMQAQMMSLFQIEGLQPIWLDTPQFVLYQRWFTAMVIAIYVVVYSFGFFIPLFALPAVMQELGLPPISPLTFWFLGILFGFLLGFIAARYMFYTWSGAFWSGLLMGLFCLSFTANLGIVAFILMLVMALVTITAYKLAEQFHITLRGKVGNEQIVVLEKATWLRKKVQPSSPIAAGLIGLSTSIVMTLIDPGDFPPLSLFIPATLIIIAATTILVSFSAGLAFGELEMRQQPNQGIWRSLSNANRIFLIQAVGIVGIVPGVVLIMSPAFGLFVLGIVLVLYIFPMWLIFGGFTVLQHAALRRVLYQQQHIPQNYAHFLDYAASLILLRKVGGGYIFIHRYLLEYFAGLSPSEEIH